MLDYIIVGAGLAGIAFAEKLENENRTFIIISDSSQNSSLIAAGLYNPVVLKRFTAVWNAKKQLELVSTYYKQIEAKLNVRLDYKLNLYRKFHSLEEQNDWFAAADKVNLQEFLSMELVEQVNSNIPNSFKFGNVLQSGYVDTELLINRYHEYLIENKLIVQESFDFDSLKIFDGKLVYKKWQSKNIVFAEGFGMLKNPFFNQLPLDGTKGELLIIHCPNLILTDIVKSSIFLIPVGIDLYKVGATYNWQEKDANPTKKAKQELITDLKKLITLPFEIVKHQAGVRPTVKDRRPLIGTHPKFKNLHLLNGLGTRGVMLAPTMAEDLYNFIENKIPLDKTIDIMRCKNWF